MATKKRRSKKTDAPAPKQDHHYFASTFTDWVVAPTFMEVIKKLPLSSIAMRAGFITIYRVPGDWRDNDYRIEDYAPCVEGAEVIFIDRGAQQGDTIYRAAAVRTQNRKGRFPEYLTLKPEWYAVRDVPCSEAEHDIDPDTHTCKHCGVVGIYKRS